MHSVTASLKKFRRELSLAKVFNFNKRYQCSNGPPRNTLEVAPGSDDIRFSLTQSLLLCCKKCTVPPIASVI